MSGTSERARTAALATWTCPALCIVALSIRVFGGPITSAEQAIERGRQWLGQANAVPTGRATLDRHEARALHGAAWTVSLRSTEGHDNLLVLDADTGRTLQWAVCNRQPYGNEPGEPVVGPDEARRIASDYASRLCPSFRTGDWEPALGGTPLRRSDGYQWAWYPVVDTVSGALGPNDLAVDVDFRTGEVIGFLCPYEGPWLIPTQPSIGRAQMLANARRFALLDPLRYPINHVSLRVQMDDYGSQRLVWECLQVLDVNVETGVLMYGVVFDAHTGEPLYPIAPIGGGKYPARSVRLPRHASVMLEPGRRALSTQLCPPVLGREGLWLRAEHLRAVDGVEVDVTREGVTVHHSGRTIGGTDLGA
ncbi:MAG: hypothetical protein GX446_10800, partial [Chthonomonadales bacterium]|nr:hypothetical protein [Chthonomonadales bacterium]